MAGYDLEPLILQLESLSDKKYAELNQTLSPTARGRFIGVRVPRQRAIAKGLAASENWRDFLEASRDADIFELKMLHAMVLGYAKCGIEERLQLIDAFLPHIDDWAQCDTLCSTLKPKAKDMEAAYLHALGCAGSDEEFRKRYGLVLLMSRFHDAPYIDGTMQVYRSFRHEGYYARMGAAWGLATLWLFAREEALAILRDGVWDDFTHNRAIQKLRESYRVSDADKSLVQSLRRKKVNQ